MQHEGVIASEGSDEHSNHQIAGKEKAGTIIQAVLKKRNRLGLYYKRIVTLTDEPRPRFCYSQDPLQIYHKCVSLAGDAKIVKFE